ncbi:MAG: Isoleucine 2-epimerase [bacterium]|nr:aspartate aminotransferase family protein [bacterium]MBV6483257.1 Isoleucine 2-epimerase [bacterium]MCE7906845.1 aspartate aminotransferase family protein [Candidatus Omnitrophica bacterium COP1]
MQPNTYPRIPQEIAPIATDFRRIQSALPHPASIPLLEKMEHYEARSMHGQPPVIWHRAHRYTVEDPYGNRWIDLSSGVLVANAGHGRSWVRAAMADQLERGLHHCYCFPHEARAALSEKLVQVTPASMEKAFLLTTGSEAIECAIKISRRHGTSQGGNRKKRIISFQNAFHGRTLGSQMAGGIPALKAWIQQEDPTFVQVPFPDGYQNEETRFESFLGALSERSVTTDEIACVLLETYQGATASFAPVEFMQALREWCTSHQIVLVLDEVQAGFGRCGKWFGFEHYRIEPDLMCCGKGISSGMPLSAVLGKAELMDQFGHGEMTSTHSGNPICCRAALAGIEIIEWENLVENSNQLGQFQQEFLQGLKEEARCIGVVHGKGLVSGIRFVKPGTKEPDGELAHRITQRCYENGILTFAPVGPGGGTIKINPPLCIDQAALEEALGIFREIVLKENS